MSYAEQEALQPQLVARIKQLEAERDSLAARVEELENTIKWDRKLNTSVSALEASIKYCKERDAALAEAARLRDLLKDAQQVVAQGVSLVTLDKLSKWTGVRGWQEAVGDALAEPTEATPAGEEGS